MLGIFPIFPFPFFQVFPDINGMLQMCTILCCGIVLVCSTGHEPRITKLDLYNLIIKVNNLEKKCEELQTKLEEKKSEEKKSE